MAEEGTKISAATTTTPVSTDMIPFSRVADATARHMTAAALDTYLFDKAVVINESGADVDTRIEAVGHSSALFVQGSDGMVTISKGLTLPYVAGSYPSLQIGSNVYGLGAASSNLYIYTYEDYKFISSSVVIAAIDTQGGGGALVLKEATTPTAVAGYGKIYTKDDNNLYFQSGAGVEYAIYMIEPA